MGPQKLLRWCDRYRHPFRFIVSPEDAIEHSHLKDFTRRLMRQIEQDLVTKLNWVSVDHHNRGDPQQPHRAPLQRGWARIWSGTAIGDAFRQTLRAGHLQKLRRIGLAEDIAPSLWRLASDLEPVF